MEISPKKRIVWNEDKCNLLTSLYKERKTISECAEIFKTSYKSISRQLCKMRLVNKHRRYKWTDDKIQYVRKNFPYVPTSTIALIMGVSEGQIRKIAKRIGAKKDKEYMRQMRAQINKERNRTSEILLTT